MHIKIDEKFEKTAQLNFVFYPRTIYGSSFRLWKLEAPRGADRIKQRHDVSQVLEEWELDYIEDLENGEESETCLCHHNPIREVCHIRNTENDNVAIVGNCCVKKFEGETAFKGNHKIFDALKKIKKSDTASANEELIEYAYKQKILTKADYDFYMDIWRKRVLSGAQEAWKVRLNQRIVTSMARQNRQSQQASAIAARTLSQVFEDLKARPTGIADQRLVQLAHEQQILNAKDMAFYVGLIEKKVTSLSVKQQPWLNDLNRRMIEQLVIVANQSSAKRRLSFDLQT